MNFQTPEDSDSAHQSADPASPASLREALRSGVVRELDVRPALAAGQEPFALIKQVVDSLEPGEVFKLLVPFEPIPLYGVLGRKGFQHWARRAGEGKDTIWEIFFFRQQSEPIEALKNREEIEAEFAGSESSILELDVRGMSPPEPLDRVLETVEQMAYGDVLRVMHHRNPLILFDLLAERGFHYRSRQQGDELWEVRIWRKK